MPNFLMNFGKFLPTSQMGKPKHIDSDFSLEDL